MANEASVPHHAANATLSPAQVVKDLWRYSPSGQNRQALLPRRPHPTAQPAASSRARFSGNKSQKATSSRGAPGIAWPAAILPHLGVSAGRGRSCSPRVTPGLSVGSAPCPSSAPMALPHSPPAQPRVSTHHREHPTPAAKQGPKLG